MIGHCWVIFGIIYILLTLDFLLAAVLPLLFLTLFFLFLGYIPWLLHYFDDFFICARSQQDCLQHMHTFKSACDEFGVPLASDKTVGPASTVTYLGIEINSSHQTIKMPNDKFLELQSLLATWYGRKKCTKRDFLSLIGSVSFACKLSSLGVSFFIGSLIYPPL